MGLSANVNTARCERWYHCVKYVRCDMTRVCAADRDALCWVSPSSKNIFKLLVKWYICDVYTTLWIMVCVCDSLYITRLDQVHMFTVLVCVHVCMHIWLMLQVHVGSCLKSHILSYHLFPLSHTYEIYMTLADWCLLLRNTIWDPYNCNSMPPPLPLLPLFFHYLLIAWATLWYSASKGNDD